MEYISGQIHESFQRLRYVELLIDFNIPILEERWVNSTADTNYPLLELTKGDILAIRFFKPSDVSPGYTYIESVIKVDGSEKVKRESSLSRIFVEYNTDNNVLFRDITKQFDRDKIISILKF